MGIKKKERKSGAAAVALAVESCRWSPKVSVSQSQCAAPTLPSLPLLACRAPSLVGMGGGGGWWSGRSTKGVKMNKRRGNQSNQGALIPPCTSASPPPLPPDYLHFSHAIAVAPFAPSRQYINILCVIDREPQKKTPTAALLMKH